ncbi:kinesin motor protein cin8 [Tulasnella sp. 403]|nr:kinesin motor protein cin8 [Tulasnella sp. 403]
MRDELIKQVSTLLVGFTDARDASMREAINAVRSDIVEGQDHMRAFGERTGVVEEDVEGRLARAEDVLEERLRDGEKLRDGGMKALSSAKTIVTSELTAWQTGMASQATKQASAVKNHAQMLSSGHTAALERLDRCKRARIEVATSLEGEVREGLGSLREGILGTSKRIEEGMEGVSEEVSNLGHFAEELSGSGVATVGQIRDIAGRLMVEGTKEDVPTGATPRKRQWEVVDEWEVTEGREEVLRKWRSVRQRGEEHKGEVDKMADENAPMDVDPVGGAPDEEVEDGASTSCATAVEAAPTPPPVRLPIAEIVKPSTRRMKPPTKTGRTGGVKTRSGMPLVEKPTNVPPPMTTNGKGLMTRRTLR